MAAKNSRLVYSSDRGRIEPEKKKAKAARGDGIARVRRETKGRGGKTVTTIAGIGLDAAELKELASQLKRACGTGGSLKNGVIEIQGDRVEAVMAELQRLGHKSKRAGG